MVCARVRKKMYMSPSRTAVPPCGAAASLLIFRGGWGEATLTAQRLRALEQQRCAQRDTQHPARMVLRSCAAPISGTLLLRHQCADVAVWSPHATITACAWTMTSVIALCAITPIIVLHALALAGQAPRKVGEAAAGTNLPHVPVNLVLNQQNRLHTPSLLVFGNCGARGRCLFRHQRRLCNCSSALCSRSSACPGCDSRISASTDLHRPCCINMSKSSPIASAVVMLPMRKEWGVISVTSKPSAESSCLITRSNSVLLTACTPSLPRTTRGKSARSEAARGGCVRCVAATSRCAACRASPSDSWSAGSAPCAWLSRRTRLPWRR